MGPPGIDVAPHLDLAAILVVEVEFHGAAAAGLGRGDQLDPGSVEHARGGGVDVGRHGRLHAAFEHQHLARMAAGGKFAGRALFGHLGLQALGQQAAHGLAQLHRGREQRRRQPFLERPAHGALAQRARHLFIDDLATNIHQVAVLHAAGAGRFAVAAGQAAVQVQLGLARGFGAFEHLLHQVDASARAVELIAQQLIGRAGGGAEAAVHAFAQDGLGLLAVGRVLELGSELGLHK